MLTGEVKPLDNLVSFDDLMSEIYDPYPDARQLKPGEQYQRTAEARKFPSFGRYGASTRYADRLPYMPQVAYLPVLDIGGLEEDFRALPRLRRIVDPPPGIPENREYVHGKGTDDDRAKKPRIDAHLSNLKMYNEKFKECLPAIREVIKSDGATIARELGGGASGTAYSVCSTEEAAIEGKPCKFVVKFFSPGDETIDNETEILEELQDVPMMERNGESWQPYPTLYGSGECQDIGFVVLEALDPNPHNGYNMPIDDGQEYLDTLGYLAEQGFLQVDTHLGNLMYRDGKPVIIDWGLGEQWKKKEKDLDLFYPRFSLRWGDERSTPTSFMDQVENIESSVQFGKDSSRKAQAKVWLGSTGGKYMLDRARRLEQYKIAADPQSLNDLDEDEAIAAIHFPKIKYDQYDNDRSTDDSDEFEGYGVVKEMKLYRNNNDPKMLDKKSFKEQEFVFFMDKVDESRYIYTYKATYLLKNPNLVVIDEDDDDAGIAGEFSRKESLDALRKLKSSNPKAQGVWLKFNDEVILWKFGSLKRVEAKGGSTYKHRAARRFNNFMHHKVVSKKQVKKFL